MWLLKWNFQLYTKQTLQLDLIRFLLEKRGQSLGHFVFLDVRELCQLKIIISHPCSQHLVMWNGLKANHFLEWFVPNGVPKQRKMWSDQKIDLSFIRKGEVLGIQQIKAIGIPKQNNRDFKTWKLLKVQQSPLVLGCKYLHIIPKVCTKCLPPLYFCGVSPWLHIQSLPKYGKQQVNKCVLSSHVTPWGKGVSFHMSNSLGWDSWGDNMFLVGCPSLDCIVRPKLFALQIKGVQVRKSGIFKY